MPSNPATKKTASGPGYYDLIKEAVLTLKERTGSSRQAIDKYVAAKKGENYSKSRLNLALRKGVEAGKLVAVKGSFKLAADEKKAAQKKMAAKTPSTEKKTVKKSVTTAKKPAAKSTKAAGKKTTAAKTTARSSKAKKPSIKKATTTKKKTVKKSAAKKSTKKPTATKA